ncbi:MAG: PepSY domain-containing protein, partial [Candidatus Ruminococcus intestinipullorum]|nr:PepSY domain-containing protein [Candidatus Ruminococcus intestinipullorum]
MMKKIYYTAVPVFAAALVMIGCSENTKDIGKEAAQKIAFIDAGIDEDDVTRVRVSKEREDGEQIYEVEFTVPEEGKEFSYEILAEDGSILTMDQDMLEGVQNNQETQNTQNSQNTQNTESTQNTHHIEQDHVGVSVEQARELALARVPGASESDIIIELDYDDGRYKYEGDIIYNNRQYDFEIDANTGNFL